VAEGKGGGREAGGVRLDETQIAAIKAGVIACFGSDAVVKLYGSRLDDRRRGGDIDLFIEVAEAVPDYRRQASFLDRVEPALDHRKVDLHFMVRGSTPSGFDRIVQRDGQLL
jgi:predicted nucleotidyltransferase